MLELPHSPLRRKLFERVVDEGFDALVDIEGLLLVERRNPRKDREKNLMCDWFVFNRCLEERWYKRWRAQDSSELFDLFSDTSGVLAEQGYRSVSRPKDGDVVAYADRYLYDRRQFLTRHFGLWEHGDVVSKWCEGHVFLHPVGHFFDYYGKYVRFYRRNGR